LKKAQLGGHLSLELVANPDILAGIDAPGLFKVGFAAETSGELLAVAKDKLTAKRCQLLVANDVSHGAVFGQDDNKVLIVDADGVVAELAATKAQIATELIDIIASRLG
jgi:phosphopantothenoylcysteine decarboxylase/phosphopantothenate--cysteine ligase